MFVDILLEETSILAQYLENYILLDKDVTYGDQSAGVAHSGLGLDLLEKGLLDFLAGGVGGGGRRAAEDTHCEI